MEFSSSTQTQDGVKSLAAIVFTDVVGYSRHAQIDEARTLRNFQRDFRMIEQTCLANDGKVLKTMGDGVLMQFSSANQALQCALQIQEAIFRQSKLVERSDVLEHRIGVHLGDVITTSTDVVGDGVNIANRIQAAAKPDSIMLSRTVYDVVKGKINFEARYVGPMVLKGIKDPIVVWEIPPILQQETAKKNRAILTTLDFPAMEQSAGLKGIKAVIVVLACLIAVGGFTVFFANAVHKQEMGPKQDLLGTGSANQIRIHQNMNAIGDKIRSENASAGGSSGSQTPLTGDPKPGGTSTSTSNPNANSGNSLFADASLAKVLKTDFLVCDYKAMVTAVSQSPYSNTPEGITAIQNYTQLDSLLQWTQLELSYSDSTKYYQVPIMPGMQGSVLAYDDPAKSLILSANNVEYPTKLTSLTPDQLIALDTAIIAVPTTTDQTSAVSTAAEIALLKNEAERFNSIP